MLIQFRLTCPVPHADIMKMDLQKLILEYGTWNAVAKALDMPAGTIRKQASRLGIRSKNYRNHSKSDRVLRQEFERDMLARGFSIAETARTVGISKQALWVRAKRLKAQGGLYPVANLMEVAWSQFVQLAKEA